MLPLFVIIFPTFPQKQWKVDKDNAIEGFIYGSNSFKDGVFVTTSPIIKGKLVNGNLVRTSSGSEYFLE
jgi:hypothetical protein